MNCDDGSALGPGGGDYRGPTHLSSGGLQHAGGRVAHLRHVESCGVYKVGVAVWYVCAGLQLCTVGTTVTGEATLTGRLLDPGLAANVFTIVAPGGTFSTVAVDGGIFCVAAAAAANAAIPLI